MAFREKVAWITLVAMVIAYGVYFPIAAWSGRGGIALLAMFGVVTVAQVIVIAIGTGIAAALTPGEANGPADERDRAIDRRASATAYFVLITGMILVGVVMPFSEAGWAITNAALAALVTAELVRHAVILVSYRRGWHG